MTTPYVDPQTIHNPATSTSPPASWGDTIRDDLEFLINPPMVRVNCSTGNTSVPSASFTILPFSGTVDYDTDSFKTSTTQFTVPAGLGGKYHIMAHYATGTSGASTKAVAIQVNGSRITQNLRNSTGASEQQIMVMTDYALTAGDVVSIHGYQNSGSPENWPQRSSIAFFSMRWVSR